jgi:hypothetical protein
MKPALALGVAALVLAGTGKTADTAAKEPGECANRTFEKIERDWADALVKADKRGLNRYEAPEYTLVTATGATLTRAQADGELLNGNQHFDALEISGVRARCSSSLAVVTGHAKSSEKYKSQDNSGDYEFIDVFVRRHGRWMAVHAQLTRTLPLSR